MAEAKNVVLIPSKQAVAVGFVGDDATFDFRANSDVGDSTASI